LRYFKEHWSYLTTAGAYPGIDALRLAAVGLVLFFHFAFVQWGWIGVDLFFVLSGFLIGGALIDQGREDRISFTRFYGHRAMRILPIYYFFIAACFFFKKHEAGTALPSLAAAFTFMQTTGQYYFKWPVDSSYIPGGSWTLVIEETFYVLAPLFIWLLTKVTKNAWVIAGVFGAIFLSGVPARLLATAEFNPTDPNWHFASFVQFHSRFDELAAGVCAAAIIRGSQGKHSRWFFGILAAAGAFIFWTFIHDRVDLLAQPQMMTRQTIWMPSLLAFTFACTVLAAYDFQFNAPWVIIGARLSYGLYLMHILVLELTSPIAGEGWMLAISDITSFKTRGAIMLIASVVLTYFLSITVEYPFIRMYRKPKAAQENPLSVQSLMSTLAGTLTEKKRQEAIEAVLAQAVRDGKNIATSVELKNGFYEVNCVLVSPGEQPTSAGEWEIFETMKLA
jgi:peptidoglycan/LPS O-acetylase OafA/YrhL